MVSERQPILLVDDEEYILEMAEYYLDSIGYEVQTASSVAEAIEKLNGDKHFKYIISDVRMPGGSGLKLLDHIPTLSWDPKIVFISGFSDITESEVKEKGATAYFEKPADYQEIIDFLRNTETQ